MQDGTIMARLAGRYDGEGDPITLVSVDREFSGDEAVEEAQRAFAPERVFTVLGDEYLKLKALVEDDVQDLIFWIEFYGSSGWQPYGAPFGGKLAPQLVGV